MLGACERRMLACIGIQLSAPSLWKALCFWGSCARSISLYTQLSCFHSHCSLAPEQRVKSQTERVITCRVPPVEYWNIFVWAGTCSSSATTFVIYPFVWSALVPCHPHWSKLSWPTDQTVFTLKGFCRFFLRGSGTCLSLHGSTNTHFSCQAADLVRVTFATLTPIWVQIGGCGTLLPYKWMKRTLQNRCV